MAEGDLTLIMVRQQALESLYRFPSTLTKAAPEFSIKTLPDKVGQLKSHSEPFQGAGVDNHFLRFCAVVFFSVFTFILVSGDCVRLWYDFYKSSKNRFICDYQRLNGKSLD